MLQNLKFFETFWILDFYIKGAKLLLAQCSDNNWTKTALNACSYKIHQFLPRGVSLILIWCNLLLYLSLPFLHPQSIKWKNGEFRTFTCFSRACPQVWEQISKSILELFKFFHTSQASFLSFLEKLTFAPLLSEPQSSRH